MAFSGCISEGQGKSGTVKTVMWLFMANVKDL